MEVGQPLLFINIDEQGKCVINPEALEVVRAIQTPVCVLSVAGLYRTGKSFLLNRLLGLQDAFEIGPTVNPCTKGLWIWSKPVSLSYNRTLLLIDTEGLGSFERDETVDMHIFSLSVLLSSMLIYNSMGSIDEQAIASLSLVCKLTQHVHIKANSANSAAAYAAYFPAFIWVLRDFSLQLEEAGRKTSAREYLEGCLRPVEGSTPDVLTKNQIRRTILDFFKDRDCVTLIRPVNDERQLREINTLPYDTLRPKFREQVEDLVTKVLNTVRVKMIEGTVLTGEMLAELTTQYTEAINNDSIPTIAPAWERVVDSQLKNALKQGVMSYKSYMDSNVTPNIPMEVDEFKEHDQIARADAEKLLAAIPVNAGNQKKITDAKATLSEKLEAMMQSLAFNNAKESKTACTKLARECVGVFEDKVATFKRGQEMVEAWDTLCRAYESKAVGPSKLETAWELLGKSANIYFSRVLNRLENSGQTQIREMSEKMTQIKAELQETQRKYQLLAKDHEEMVETERKRLRENRKQMDQTIEDAKSALGANSRQFASIQEKLQRENGELTEQNRRLQRQITELNDQIRRLQESAGPRGAELQMSVESVLRQIRQTQEEKAQLASKLEYDSKLTRKSHTEVEKMAQKQLIEARKTNEDTVRQLKKSYNAEIKVLKEEKDTLEAKLREVKTEIIQRDMQLRLVEQRIQAYESEQSTRIEHADLICSVQLTQVADLIVKFLEQLDPAKASRLHHEIVNVQGMRYAERASQIAMNATRR